MPLTLSADLAPHLDAFLALEQAASAPYGAFVYGDAQQALTIARALLAAGTGEFAPPHGWLAVDEAGRPVGMVAFLDGKSLLKARLGAAKSLSQHHLLGAETRARAGLAATTLCRCAPDDFYLSRIAVDTDARQSGTGRWLLARCIDAARAAGARRVLLEVSPVATAARALYASAGFRAIDRKTVQDPATGRTLDYEHLELIL